MLQGPHTRVNCHHLGLRLPPQPLVCSNTRPITSCSRHIRLVTPPAAATETAAAEPAADEEHQQPAAPAESPAPAQNDAGSSSSAEEETAALLAQIRAEVARRRNFAIISHPVSAGAMYPSAASGSAVCGKAADPVEVHPTGSDLHLGTLTVAVGVQ